MIQNSFAHNLRLLRKKAGLTQEKLADLVQVSLKTVQRWESGTRTPRIEEVKKICQVFNISEQDLLNNSQNQKWTLTIKIADNEKEVIDMTQSMPAVSSINVTKNGAFLELGGNWELFSDDDKFQDLLEQLYNSRESVLRMGKEMFNVWNKTKTKKQ